MIKNPVNFLLPGFLFFFFVLPQVQAQKYMKIKQKDGTTIEIALSDIQKLTFSNLALAAPEKQAMAIKAALTFKTFPNPSAGPVTIDYFLAESGKVTIEVFNLQGQKVYGFICNQVNIGENRHIWNADKRISGTYVCRITQNNKVYTQKIIISKP